MAEMLIGIARGADRHPDRLAVTDEFGRELTYGELDALVNRMIRALNADGIAAGDVIALLLDNQVETIALHQVAYRGGMYFTPLNPRLLLNELEYLLSDSQAKVLFADERHLELARLAAEGAGVRLVVVGSAETAEESLEEFAAKGSAEPVSYQFGSVMAYTSGTSGRPKAVVRDRTTPSPEAVEMMMRFGERLDFDTDHDRHLTTAPLYHGGPLIAAMHSMNLGGTIHLLRRFEPDHVLGVIESARITSMYMVPTMYHRMLKLPEARLKQADTSSLKSVMHTGAPCPPHLKRRMIEWLGPVVYECYAATEAYGTYTVCTSQQWLEHPGTVGKPEHDVITIRDETGQPLPAGEVGLVYAKTLPGIAPFRYRDDPEKTAAAYGPDGDYTIGDLGYLDKDGFLYLTGRATDMIISGGVNIYPAETEQVLFRHEAVRDAAVFGIPDEEWGESVVAVVQVAPEADDVDALADELIAFCRQNLAKYKCPRRVHLVDDLGRDPSGKLRKELLRDRILAETEVDE